jgi:hypothetical protein
MENKRSYYCHVLPSKPVRSLFDRRNVESVEEINATYWGANSAVFVEGENEETVENVSNLSLVS